MTFRPMPFMTLCAIAGLAVLVWLGSWQWARYHEKLNMPEQLPAAGQVTLKGEQLTSPLQYVYTTHNGEALWRSFAAYKGCVIAPNAEETCNLLLLVDVGLLSAVKPNELGFEAPQDALDGKSFVYVENGHKTVFSPSDTPSKNLWYTANAQTMANSLSLSGFDAAYLFEPVTISIIRKSPNGSEIRSDIENPFANPAKLDDLPPARHLGYALTWFGLAGTLIAVYLAFHMSTGRLRFRKKTV